MGASDLLYLPPSLRHFEAFEGPGRGLESPLEYDLVEALRPALTVDLGTGHGGAFFSLCQSARDHDVDGLVYAVDPWADDASNEADSHGTSASINNFAHTHFRGIAYLLRVTPEEALRHFPERSIALLRIDVGRLKTPLEPLLAAYAPRVAKGGVVLVCGLSEEDGTLAAFRRFGEGRGVTIPGDRAMGLVRLGDDGRDASQGLLSLLRSEDETDHAALGDFYAHAIRHHALRAEVRDAPGLFRKKG